MKNLNEIKIVQIPIIAHQLQEAGKEVTARIQSLNLKNQVATVDTIKVLKEIRADLNKEFDDFESARKAIKEGVNAPYMEFEAIYKAEISEKYGEAKNILKDKIADFEDAIKAEKKNAVQSYFDELCASEGIDFVSFDRLGLDINLSTTEKKYKEQVNEFIGRVNDDLKLINALDDSVEIFVEYKATLNASSAITKVKERKESEKRERESLIQWRQNHLQDLGFTFNEAGQRYEWSEDIHITIGDVNTLNKWDFEAKLVQFETAKREVIAKKENPTIQAPKVVEAAEVEAIKVAAFEVRATLVQLQGLGEYMRANNIIYKNI